MVYHEIQKKGEKTYNYLVKTVREGKKWSKVRKYIGGGHIPKDKLKEENYDNLKTILSIKLKIILKK